MKKLFPGILLLFGVVGELHAQKEEFVPDMSRALFHTRLDKAQQQLLARDGRADDAITADKDQEVNLQLTYQATTRIDALQKDIEVNKEITSNQKIGYIRGLTDLITDYGNDITIKKASWNQLPALLSSFEAAVKLTNEGKSVLPAIKDQPYRIASAMAKNIAFSNSPGKQEMKESLLRSYIKENPTAILRELIKDVNYSFTDSLVKVAAHRMPEQFISYAQARQTSLGIRMREVAKSDPLVKLIVELSGQKSGQMYFPFIDDMYRGNLDEAEVSKALKDSTDYYSLLVKTEVAYAGRLAKGDTPVAMKALDVMLKQKSSELYVTTINGLHESPNSIRFKSIQKLSPEELYYVIVMNEPTIYTSSYVYVYNRIFEVMKEKSSDSLMHMVNYDRYKKFLTMASNYNTLDDFLAKMSPASSTALMTDFVNNLDKGADADDIEDAVDVANAYASINSPEIKKLMLDQVDRNLQKALASNNRKGSVVYHIEKLIMESNNNASDTSLNLTDSLGIPPVYEVKNDYLKDGDGRIIMQMFFYGDTDGRLYFNRLLASYSDRRKWAVKSTKDWVQISSVGTPVPFILFANRPLDELKDEDEEAQRNLIQYMHDNDFEPTITVHRGHSYYLKYTIQKMLPSSKVVVLGSCGAYQNLSDILAISPEAYIISSKQVGQGIINIALLDYLVDNLKYGKRIVWPEMMSVVGGRFGKAAQDGYDDYVFPHQNLGALFIKAYKIASEQEAELDNLSSRN